MAQFILRIATKEAAGDEIPQKGKDRRGEASRKSIISVGSMSSVSDRHNGYMHWVCRLIRAKINWIHVSRFTNIICCIFIRRIDGGERLEKVTRL